MKAEAEAKGRDSESDVLKLRSYLPFPAGCSKGSFSKAAASRRTEAYPSGYVEVSDDAENDAGGLFQHPAKNFDSRS